MQNHYEIQLRFWMVLRYYRNNLMEIILYCVASLQQFGFRQNLNYTNGHRSHNLRANRTIMGLHRQLYLPSCLQTNGALIRLHFPGMRLDAYCTNGNDREI